MSDSERFDIIEKLQAEITRLNAVLDDHINLLLRLSAFDAPEAKTLATTLDIERKRIKGDE